MRYNRLVALTALVAYAGSARAELIYGITGQGAATGNLVSFDSANPAGFTTVGPITGITAGQVLRGIDFRPATGELYGLSAGTAGTTTAGQLYTINLTTGVATPVGAPLTLTGNTSTVVSIDFNPVLDNIRVITSTSQNFRVDPTTAAVTVDAAINPNPQVTAIAHSNNVAGATTSTLFAIDFNTDSLNTIADPNAGTITAVGPLGAAVVQFNGASGFDISGATGVAYLSIDENVSPTSAVEFYTVNLQTGSATLVAGEVPNLVLLDISVFIAPVPEPATVGLTAALGLGLTGWVRRRRAAARPAAVAA